MTVRVRNLGIGKRNKETRKGGTRNVELEIGKLESRKIAEGICRLRRQMDGRGEKRKQ